MAARKPRRKQPPATPLSREKILDVSEKVVNEVGIEGFSMRQLARELGATPMSLYWHFENKADVLDALLRRVFTRIELPQRRRKSWRAATIDLLSALREQFLEHQTVVTAMATAVAPKEAFIWANEVIALMQEAGLKDREAVYAFNLLLRYTVSASTMIVGQPGQVEVTRTELRREVEKVIEELPQESIGVWSGVRRHFRQDKESLDAEFRFGLERILDGLERYIER